MHARGGRGQLDGLGPVESTESSGARKGRLVVEEEAGTIAAGDGGKGAGSEMRGRRRQSKKRTFYRHPDFPHLPASVPLTYTLTMQACLSLEPRERPTFPQILTILSDLRAEVARGHYINGEGRAQVHLPLSSPGPAQKLAPLYSSVSVRMRRTLTRSRYIVRHRPCV
jgi:hypothetical protein